MSNGIAGLRRYQVGGNVTSSDPDQEERRREIWRMMAAQRDARAHTISLRPDTLMDRDRANMMYHLNLRGDTTGFTQQGIEDWFQSGELEEGAELVRQMREMNRVSNPQGYARALENSDLANLVGMYGSTDEDNPSVLSYGSPGSNVAGSYSIQGPGDEISLNIPPAFEPAYARGRDDLDPLEYETGWQGDLDRFTNEAIRGRIPRYTEAQWEQTPEDALRRSHGHELGHAALYLQPGNLFSGGGWGRGFQEDAADNFGAVLEALRNAAPGDTRRDVLREADRLIYDYPSGYTRSDINRRDGWSDGRGGREFTESYGTFSDPLVVDPRAKLSRKNTMGGGTKWIMEAILDTEQFADHPLNRGWFSRLREGVGSLFGRERER